MSLIRTPEDITSAWLASLLGEKAEVRSVEAIGTGQMSSSFRVAYEAGEGESTLVVKLAATSEASRGTGVAMGAYEREITFYRELRDRIGGPLAACLLATYDAGEGWFTLVLEDIRDAVQGDQIAGCSPEVAEVALRALARIQAPVFNDPVLASSQWLNQPTPLNQALLTALFPGFLERYRERLAAEHAEVCERFVAAADAWDADRRPPLGLVHGDFRLDNLLFHDSTCTVVDWQTLSWGPVMRDASYFVAGGLKVEDRRAQEERLMRGYHDELTGHGVSGFGWEQCWEEYRRQCFLGVVMTVAASMVVERTDRGDDMFMAWIERNAQMALDLEALELLPAPQAAGTANPPLRPGPGHEGRHEPGAEQLWNESWYFDAVAEDGSLGVYHRIGLLPNLGVCLLSSCIVRPDKPAVMLIDAQAPLPGADSADLEIHSDSARGTHRCEVPLERFRIEVEGAAAAHADHSAPLRGEPGEPLEIALDLRFESEGVPYQWRLATRYEIPCRVSGTVRIGDESLELRGPGQRDHSWGSRDWWASDWMWSALHLDDGTHTHAVTVPTHPDFGVGYVQRGEELTELSAISSSEEIAENGLITSGQISMGQGDEAIVVSLEPLAFGAILLEAPDGRISHFPRAMCRVSAADGRMGWGWVEWNRNQP